MIEYGVLVDDDENRLARDVNARLRAGWQLQGGVAIRAVMHDGDSDGTVYAQAVFREVKENES